MRSVKIVAMVLMFAIMNEVSADAENKSYIPVSMIQLFANPQLYDRQYISVDGVINVDLPNSSLYFSQEFYKASSLGNRIVLPLDHVTEELCFANGEFVTVLGQLRYFQSSSDSKGRLFHLEILDISAVNYSGSTVYPPTALKSDSTVAEMIKLLKSGGGLKKFPPGSDHPCSRIQSQGSSKQLKAPEESIESLIDRVKKDRK